MTDLSPAAQAVLNAYRDLSWTPDEEDNGKCYKFCHKAGMAAALRAVAEKIEDLYCESDVESSDGVVFALRQLVLIADELERQ